MTRPIGDGFPNSGINGQVWKSDGRTGQWEAQTSANIQTFLASGTWTKPSGYDPNCQVRIQGWGAGGSGGGVPGATFCGGGGGGGAYKEYWITLSGLGATETVTVGAGGTSVSAANGIAGGNSTFGAHLEAYGGGGGGGYGVVGVNCSGGGGGGSGTAGGTAAGATPGAAGLAWASAVDYTGGVGGTQGDPPTAGGVGHLWGGGGGGGGDSLGQNTTGVGGDSTWGGAGGGGAGESVAGAWGGVTIYGGWGGTGGTTGGNGTPGAVPGGGGGGAEGAQSGVGGNGKIIVTVFA